MESDPSSYERLFGILALQTRSETGRGNIIDVPAAGLYYM